MCFYFGTLLTGKGNLMPSLCFLRNEISRSENGKSSTYQDCHNMQSFVWNYLLLVSQRWGKHFLPELLELRLGSIFKLLL